MVDGAASAALDFDIVGDGALSSLEKQSRAGATPNVLQHFKKLTTQSQRARPAQGTGVTVVLAAVGRGWSAKLRPVA